MIEQAGCKKMTKEARMEKFGERVRVLRDNKGLSQKELADRIGMTRSIISTYETGQKMPTYGKLIKLADVLEVSTDYLLGVENDSILDLSGLSEAQDGSIKDVVTAMDVTDRKKSY